MRTHPQAAADSTTVRVCLKCGRTFTNSGQIRRRCWRCRQRVTPATPRQTPQRKTFMTLESTILLVEAQLDLAEDDRWLLQFELETLRKIAALPPSKR